MSGLTGAIVGAFVFATMTVGGLAAAPAAQAATTDTSVTVRAADYYDAEQLASADFPDLEVTISQATGLVSQGIQVNWTGGKESTLPSGQNGGANFLQFAQCWGEDPANPGHPDRTTCQYGAFNTPGATRDSYRCEGEFPAEDAEYSTENFGCNDPAYTSIPFMSATTTSDGEHEMVRNVVDNQRVSGIDVNNNQFFTKYTSNEIPWAGSGSDGTGSTKFEVQTAAQAQGLGCGSRVTTATGQTEGSSCWLVVIPRAENDPGANGITQSGLFWQTWEHHLAIKLDFRPIGITCAIGAAERQIVGSELLSTAVSSWQPVLCGSQGGDVYNMITSNESDVVAQANAATDTAPLALTTYPYSGEGTDDLTYAPVGLSAVTVSFAIDRFPKQDGTASEEALAKTRLPFESMNLTPRLIAKLLTNSYRDSLPADADRTHLGQTKGTTFTPNPRNLLFDPDFLAINDPEWSEQAIAGIAVSDMLVPQGRSDSASALWQYVMADADARAFLAGTPDKWGMVVNKYASTDAKLNPTGVGLTLPRDNFPKADPTEVAAVPGGAAALNLVTWRPYTNDLDTSAYLTLRGDGQTVGAWDPNTSPPRYPLQTRSLPGTQAVLSFSDSSSSAKYQVVTASLRNPAGQYVAATTDSMTAAAAAMVPSKTQPQVRGFDVTSAQAKSARTAYPLTMPVYAASSPYMTDAAVRGSYASFIRYAAGEGQTPGVELGQLPAGYAPLPTAWRAQALLAAAVLEMGMTRATATPSPSPTTPADPPANGVPNSPSTTTTGGSTGAVNAPAAAAAPAADADPVASGAVAGALAGAQTPDDPDIGGLATTLPASLVAGLAAAGAVLLIPRLSRRPTA